MGRWTQLRLLLWKNYILQLRRPVGTAMEILIPVLAIAFLVVIRVLTDSQLNAGIQCMSTFNELPLTKQLDLQTSGRRVAYAPGNNSNSDVDKVMRTVNSILGLPIDPYLNESAAVAAAGIESEHFGAVIFTNAENGKLPDDVSYTIRVPHNRGFPGNTWLTDSSYPQFSGIGPRRAIEYFNGFIQVEHAIEQGIIALKVGSINTSQKTLIPTLARQFPFPSYTQDVYSAIVITALPILLIVAFIYTAGTVVKELVLEKQERLKETMKMMGLANWIHWLAWFIKQFSFNFISVVLMTLIAVFGNVFKESNGFIIFLFFLIFILAGIAFTFMISSFFSSAKLGMIFGFLLWFASFFPYLIIVSPNIYGTMDKHAKSAACLFSNMCMGFAARQILSFESKGVGIQFSNIGEGPSNDDDFSVGIALGMMTLDTVLYFLICWYVEAVFPGKYGIPLPWYFLFTRSYWFGYEANNVGPSEGDGGVTGIEMDDPGNRSRFEPEPTDLETGIRIDDLKKVFKGNNGYVTAVDGISLKLFKGQITALLGHNGAGKTTTMSMLTGLFPPTSGDAIINGHSIQKNIAGVRKSLGLCPQHNVLFDRLTVKEHLHFFLSLKGSPRGDDFDHEVSEMITDLMLDDKTNERSDKLSGGMKRKLSVGIALIGHSEIVILDEPTAGMDPYARRATWDLLTKHKGGRTMLLTTHYMEEADLLGDRIAIMSNGEIRCSGSSHFLKERYGVGYHLTLVKGEQCKSEEVTKYLRCRIPTIKLNSNVGHELSYLLPRGETDKFASLFKEMEDEIGALGIESFGLSLTTMEEVFLHVEDDSEEAADVKLDRRQSILTARNSIQSIKSKKPSVSSGDGEKDRLSGFSLWLQQFYAAYIKRFLNSKRDLAAVISQLLLPVVFTILALLVLKVAEFSGDDPPRRLTLSDLGPTNGYVADLAQNHSWDLLKPAEKVLKSMGVTSIDALNGSLTIKSQIDSTQSDCCKNKFLVLNNGCIRKITDTGETFADDCKEEDFGYKVCKFDADKVDEISISPPPTGEHNCLIFSKPSDQLGRYSLRNAVGSGDDENEENCPLVPTDYINSYDTSFFMQYILERSGEAKDSDVFFEENVSGFTLVNPVTAIDYPDAPNDTEKVGVWATVWFSNQPVHAAASAVNAFGNIQLQSLLATVGVNEEDRNKYTMNVTNYPLPKSSNDRVEDANSDAGAFILPFMISFGMAFLSASFITFPIGEKISRSKHLQFLSGLTPTGYWTATIAWDFCNYLAPAVCLMILFAAFQIKAFTDSFGVIILLLLLYAWANLPLVYLFSFLFGSPYTGFAIIALMLILTSLLGTLLVFIFLIPGIDLSTAADVCRYIFYFQPNFAFSQCLADLYRNSLLKEICLASLKTKILCKKNNVSYVENDLSLTPPGIGVPVLYLFFEGIVFFALVILVEYRFFIPIRDDPALAEMTTEGEDEDVASERQEVMSADFDNSSAVVVAKNLTKQYRKATKPAVDHMSFKIPRGECFGLLGLNGAGKTTTFKMLTGDLAMSAGTAFVEGLNIRSDLHQVQRQIGYCPQFDSLIERLTGREYLTMIARLRGYRKEVIPDLVQKTINRLKLNQYADKTCGTYSGGNKRKLSTAIALVGDPSVVFLDEPTAGMDPMARRFLWDCLVDVLKEGRSIVLTSHSMEECEALCTRLGIMVNGRFQCLGSIQHLKSRFGSGFSLTIVMGELMADGRKASNDEVKQLIAKRFPEAALTEEHGDRLAFELPGNQKWSYIFGSLESARAELNLASYSVSQTTLEEVFLQFAKHQHDEMRSK
eukprot:m.23294 g.23294  ORF g.23294 m.23294 type:complete len:1794 (+) comp28455_c0_seq2:102-5483(+)